MKHVFITGGCGFVGHHLVRHLLNTPGIERVQVYDNLSSGRPFEPGELDPRLAVISGHVQDMDRLRIAMRGYDTVFHLAANADIAAAAITPRIDFDGGTVLTQNVLEAMRVNKVGQIFFTSGSGVYGERDEAFTEKSECRPISPYGAAKLGSEALVSAYSAMFGIRARIFRFANIVGSFQTHGVGYDFMRQLKEHPQLLRVLGDGSQQKSYIHISDALTAMFFADTDRGEFGGDLRPFEVFNVATDDQITVSHIAHMATEVADADLAVIQYGAGDRGWNGDVPKVRFNCDKIRALGWAPQFNSVEAMTAALLSMR